ncbi:MAG: phytanoyl-CoA dioxygenase family protein, partial [Caldilineaceae bacterium]|nr:phytanoyl-CoA dioxygenase family protein [Caldilineaceae bacterium]
MNAHDLLHRLSDEQMRRYLTDGYLVLKSGLPQEVHNHIRERCEEIFSTTGNPGNEILEMNPALQLVFTDPAVKGALSSILGEDYFMHPHRHCHQNRPGTPAQRNHKDSYEEDVNVRHHRSRWSMAMYYPQDVTADMGPTGVTPGSQYFASEESLAGHKELGVTGEAGTVILVHYDVWHRALRNDSGRNRYMLKFLFCRATEPTAPAWNNREAEWQAPAGREQDPLEPLWQAMWRWNRGDPVPAVGREYGDAALSDLMAGSETERLRAAYTIGSDAFGHRDEVFRLWRTEADAAENWARCSEHTSPCEHMFGCALANQGIAGLSLLEEALGSEDWRIRSSAVDAVGDMGTAARILALRVVAMVNDLSPWVRRNAVEALGVFPQPGRGAFMRDERYLPFLL